VNSYKWKYKTKMASD